MSDSQPSQDSTATITDQNVEYLYFAYGSNLSTDQMLDRCPSSTPIGLAFLPGWRWIINARGYANIIPSTPLPSSFSSSPASLQPLGDKHDGVFGLLYLLPSQDEASLDICEGCPGVYEKQQFDVQRIVDETGRSVKEGMCRAFVYVDEQRVEGGEAKEEYKGRMERGIEDAVGSWGLEEEYAEGMRAWLRG